MPTTKPSRRSRGGNAGNAGNAGNPGNAGNLGNLDMSCPVQSDRNEKCAENIRIRLVNMFDLVEQLLRTAEVDFACATKKWYMQRVYPLVIQLPGPRAAQTTANGSGQVSDSKYPSLYARAANLLWSGAQAVGRYVTKNNEEAIAQEPDAAIICTIARVANMFHILEELDQKAVYNAIVQDASIHSTILEFLIDPKVIVPFATWKDIFEKLVHAMTYDGLVTTYRHIVSFIKIKMLRPDDTCETIGESAVFSPTTPTPTPTVHGGTTKTTKKPPKRAKVGTR